MNKKIIFVFSLLSLFFIGTDSVNSFPFGGVTLTDTKGNKYTFKKESVTCREGGGQFNYIDCEGSAIKKDIAGNRYATEFSEKTCAFTNRYTKQQQLSSYNYLICTAAQKLGKF